MSGMIGENRTHNTHKSVEWYTPKWVFDELNLVFDLDPSSPHDHETFVPAKEKYTVFDDGLKKEWFGRVFMNPPYGPSTGQWIRRLCHHKDGIALVFSRTDASWFQDALRSATAVLFINGRIDFVPGNENKHKKSRSGAGSTLFAFGSDCARSLMNLSHRGFFVMLRPIYSESTAFALDATKDRE